jgi:hypothetical protein
MARGRYKLIESPDVLWDLFLQYKKSCKESPIYVQDYVGKDASEVWRQKERCLTFEGFEDFVADIDGMPMDLGDYFANSNGSYADFSTICSRIKRAIRKDQIEGGMAGIYNASITQRLNNLVDKSQVEFREQPLFPDL